MDTALPELRLDLSALEHNVALMAAWCAERGVGLAPHIKTTMTRPIVERQLTAGASGVTVATVPQLAVAVDWGVRRVLLANELVSAADLARVRELLTRHPDLEFACFADSLVGVRLAADAFARAERPLHVLVDVGVPGGRTGVREPATAVDVAAAVRAAPCLRLAGVAGYEGIRPNSRDPEIVAAVDAHCRLTVEVYARLATSVEVERAILTMGGSAFPDRVVAALGELAPEAGEHPELLLRSGCYVTHDHGTYAGVSPIDGLRPALTVRALVLSAPEPGLVVVGAGKRELPHDAGLPVLLAARDADGTARSDVAGTATRIFDHHLVLTDARGLEVGDEVDLGISHPCSAFDRWPEISVIDSSSARIEVWRPRFR